MTDKHIHSPEELRKLLRYDPETGKLFWLPRPTSMFPAERFCRTWNTRFSNLETFTACDHTGYLFGRIYSSNYRAHRVIWAIVTGKWPENDIDHINGDRTDNIFKNLREATRSENLRNIGKKVTNTSGFKGVSLDKSRGLWEAKIVVNYRQIHLGRYALIEDAISAYAKASEQYHGEFGRVK